MRAYFYVLLVPTDAPLFKDAEVAIIFKKSYPPTYCIKRFNCDCNLPISELIPTYCKLLILTMLSCAKAYLSPRVSWLNVMTTSFPLSPTCLCDVSQRSVLLP